MDMDKVRTTEDALQVVYSYTINRHHDYCTDIKECLVCQALAKLKEMFPIALHGDNL